MRHPVRIYRPSGDPGGPSIRRWKVNGYPASVVVWTAEDWDRLADAEKPADAQEHHDGIRVAVRMHADHGGRI